MLSKCYYGRNDIKMSANDVRTITFFLSHISPNPKPNMHSAFTDLHRPPKLVSVFPRFAD